LDSYDLALLVGGAVLPAFLVALAAGFAMRKISPRIGLIDQPGSRKVHLTPTPLGGGVAIWLGVLLPMAAGQLVLLLVTAGGQPTDSILGIELPALVRPHLPGLVTRSVELWVLLAAGSVLMFTGLADDRWNIGWQWRLGIQFAVAAACVAWQGWRLTVFVDLPWLTALLSVIWIVGLVNSFNMLDNMDGLSGGVAAIAASVLAAVMLLSPEPGSSRPQLFVAGLLLVLTGALAGFLWHNRPKARIFMGDAGSYFVGFMIAVATLLATYTSYHSSTRHAVLAPVCVMAVPLYDMVTVLYIRIREGRSPVQADKSHFSHRLTDLGLSKTQAVLTVYLLTTACGMGALLLHQVNWGGAVIIGLMVVCILALVAIFESTARRALRAKK